MYCPSTATRPAKELITFLVRPPTRHIGLTSQANNENRLMMSKSLASNTVKSRALALITKAGCRATSRAIARVCCVVSPVFFSPFLYPRLHRIAQFSTFALPFGYTRKSFNSTIQRTAGHPAPRLKVNTLHQFGSVYMYVLSLDRVSDVSSNPSPSGTEASHLVSLKKLEFSEEIDSPLSCCIHHSLRLYSPRGAPSRLPYTYPIFDEHIPYNPSLSIPMSYRLLKGDAGPEFRLADVPALQEIQILGGWSSVRDATEPVAFVDANNHIEHLHLFR
ncbi:hypothetical protein C8R44DRAFT_887927 [Mycena epipterygia]|nr:hypothetical protein C8R44DRAFT_887927 [Mycena epipterygia]